MRKLLTVAAVAIVFWTGAAYAEDTTTQSPSQTTGNAEEQQAPVSVDRVRTNRSGQTATLNILGIEVDVDRDSRSGQFSFGLFNRRR